MHLFLPLILAIISSLALPAAHAAIQPRDLFAVAAQQNRPVIDAIHVHGNRFITTKAITNRLPFRRGEKFDPDMTAVAIAHLDSLGSFQQIELRQEDLGDNKMAMHVVVVEKPLLERTRIIGNKMIRKKDLAEKLQLDKRTNIDEEVLDRLTNVIKKAYKDLNYHQTQVKAELVPNPKNPHKVTAVFNITEGPKAMITRVQFVGNKHIPDRKLAGAIFTRERWLLGFLSEAGKYDEDHFEMDKHRLEYFYRDNGYLTARVVDAKVDFSKNRKQITITFEIREGDRYTIGAVRALGDDIFSEEELKKHIEIVPGEPYKQKKLVDTMERLKALWGSKGFVYADVYPQMKPDEKDKTVDITFHTERGTRMYVNRINITGNKLTRDKVIRRQIMLEEGDMITSGAMAASKANVDYLGYFDREGVNWKVHRITDELADLELNIKEAKTGKLSLNGTYGSGRGEAVRSFKLMLQAEKRNLFGMGWDASLAFQGDRKHFRRFNFSFFDPYLFDTNISGGLSAYVRREDYEQWNNVSETPREEVVGGNIRVGFTIPSVAEELYLYLEAGTEQIKTNNPVATGVLADVIQPLINRNFQDGHLTWFGADLIKDTRNHRVYPNQGYKLTASTKIAPEQLGQNFSMIKADLESSWYSSLIGMNDLVLGLHSRFGIVRELSSSGIIPYKELFHMGGQNSVRGFIWGSIGPAFNGNPIGGRNMVQVNAELTFPILDDYSMKGHVFYDAGAGWDTPKDDISERNRRFLKRDKFDLRHSIGFGLNLIYPQAVKIDFGYKLDRNRERGESPYEWHISMNTAW